MDSMSHLDDSIEFDEIWKYMMEELERRIFDRQRQVELDDSPRELVTKAGSITFDDTVPSNGTHLFEEECKHEMAVEAWNHKFNGQRQVELTREDKEPFASGRRLGGGGVGIVHETHLDGIALALKRTYAYRLTPHQLNEIKILGRVSEKRHHHIVQLVGSYMHKQKRGYGIGLLIWPVAQTDPAALLHDLDNLGQCRFIRDGEIEELRAAMEPLMFLSASTSDQSSVSLSAWKLWNHCLERIQQSFGCIAQAVAYLHDHGIRHKNLKPSQILLSSEGLWLTDFGSSTDISEMSQSATSGGNKITEKYQAPERANKESCGRAEDVFALGCIFLEMTYAIELPVDIPRAWSHNGWSFQANLSLSEEWLRPLYEYQVYSPKPEQTWLPRTIKAMLAYTAKDRPAIRSVIDTLSTYNIPGQLGSQYFGTCCQQNPSAPATLTVDSRLQPGVQTPGLDTQERPSGSTTLEFNMPNEQSDADMTDAFPDAQDSDVLSYEQNFHDSTSHGNLTGGLPIFQEPIFYSTTTPDSVAGPVSGPVSNSEKEFTLKPRYHYIGKWKTSNGGDSGAITHTTTTKMSPTTPRFVASRPEL